MSDSGDAKPLIGARQPTTPTSKIINVKVVDGNNEVFFKIKTTAPLEKLMRAFCHRQGKDFGTVRFLLDGEKIVQGATPDSLHMEDGDILEAHQEQIGGGHTSFCEIHA